MPLDDLVSVIETLQKRIEQHGDSLRQNEIRTRTALIDPLLQALGWDVADPTLVTPEFTVNGRRADYALLDSKGAPVVFLEAKRLDESLSNHLSQVVAYASELGIQYPAITDGNKWEVYDNSKLVPIEQRRILNLSINSSYAHELALQLLLLWRPNLGSGHPIPANEPIVTPVSGQTNSSTSDSAVDPQPDIPSPQPEVPPSNEVWVSLANIQTQGNEITGYPHGFTPSQIILPSRVERDISGWWHILREVAEYLIDKGKLTTQEQIKREVLKKPFLDFQQQPNKNGNFNHQHKLSNGLFLTKTNGGAGHINNARFLLKHCDQDPATVWLKFD